MKEKITILTSEIYELAGNEFNINSTLSFNLIIIFSISLLFLILHIESSNIFNSTIIADILNLYQN